MPPKSKAMLDALLGELNKAKDDIIKTADTQADDMAKIKGEVSSQGKLDNLKIP